MSNCWPDRLTAEFASVVGVVAFTHELIGQPKSIGSATSHKIVAPAKALPRRETLLTLPPCHAGTHARVPRGRHAGTVGKLPWSG